MLKKSASAAPYMKYPATWEGAIPADPSTLVDGNFLPRGTQWNQDTVFWNEYEEYGETGQSIEFDLGGVFKIDGFIAQVDDNDAYTLSYWDLDSKSWETAWDIPNYSDGNWGMTTRPDPYDNLQSYSLVSSITTNALKLEAKLKGYGSADNYFAVSEIQAIGVPIPEPNSLILFGTCLAAFAGLRLRRKKK